MYADAAEFYDLIHKARGRNAGVEAALVTSEIRRRTADAKSLLDVGCGTGVHLPFFKGTFDVAALDASTEMLAVAALRAPDVQLTVGDMRSFDLQREFDAIVSLDSSVGYLETVDELRTAVAILGRHLRPGGVLLIEGWIESEFWLNRTVTVESAMSEGVAVARLTRSIRTGEVTDLFMRFDVMTPTELRSIDEHHVMRLSNPIEFAAAFGAAGLSFERLPHMLRPGRSVYVGVRS